MSQSGRRWWTTPGRCFVDLQGCKLLLKLGSDFCSVFLKDSLCCCLQRCLQICVWSGSDWVVENLLEADAGNAVERHAFFQLLSCHWFCILVIVGQLICSLCAPCSECFFSLFCWSGFWIRDCLESESWGRICSICSWVDSSHCPLGASLVLFAACCRPVVPSRSLASAWVLGWFTMLCES